MIKNITGPYYFDKLLFDFHTKKAWLIPFIYSIPIYLLFSKGKYMTYTGFSCKNTFLSLYYQDISDPLSFPLIYRGKVITLLEDEAFSGKTILYIAILLSLIHI